MTLEICVDSLPSALTAERGGADRLELCADLDCGGLTPSMGLIQMVKKRVGIPVFVLIRPRIGDFLYGDEDWDVLMAELISAKEAGADGIVCGSLDAQGQIHREQLADMLQAASPLPFTFHRAFDVASDPFGALETLLSADVPRLLSSGQQANAWGGNALLKDLVKMAGNRLSVMPGGGISADNIGPLIEATQARECHLSGRKTIEGGMLFRSETVQFSQHGDHAWKVADEAHIRLAKQRAHQAWQQLTPRI